MRRRLDTSKRSRYHDGIINIANRGVRSGTCESWSRYPGGQPFGEVVDNLAQGHLVALLSGALDVNFALKRRFGPHARQ